MLTPTQVLSALPVALESVHMLRVPIRRGAVQDSFDLPDGRRVIISTDRFTVFGHKVGLVPYKGQVLNQLTNWWFERTADVLPNHVIDVPDPNVTIGLMATPLPFVVVVRGYLSGEGPASLWGQYAGGQRVIYGVEFPDGLHKNQELPHPLVTAAAKRFGRVHERPLTQAEVMALGVHPALWERIQETALQLFLRGRQLCLLADLILVDSTYKFGLDLNGDLLLIDELHTPDSSRFWRAATYAERLWAGQEPERFDRELARSWYRARGYAEGGVLPPLPAELVVALSQRYQRVYERVTGRVFQPASYPAQRRIAVALRYAQVVG